MSLVHHETGELIEIPSLPAGARPLGIKVRPVLRLALGYRDEKKSGAPVKSDHFIPRAELDSVVDRFTESYGDQPKSVRILLPAELNDALDIRYVAFKGGADGGGSLVAIGQTNFSTRDYMGGPDTVTVWNQDGTVDELDIDGTDDPQLAERDIALDLRTRFRFGIPDVLGFGSFAEIQTGGAESTDNLWLKVRELYAIFGSRVTVAVEPLVVLKPSTMRAPKFEGRGKNAKQVGWQKASLFVVDLVVPESIEDMLTRLRERQQVLAPNGAAAAIYGTERGLTAPALGPGPATSSPGALAQPVPQPAESPAAGSTPEAGPAAAPLHADEEPVLEGEIMENADLDAVSSVVVPDGFGAAGQSLAEVAESPSGPEWLAWAVANPGKFPAEFAEAADTFVELRFPDVYAEAKAGQQ